MEWRGIYGEVMFGFHVAAKLHNWKIAPDDLNPDGSVLTSERAERDAFWGDYPPTSIRLRIGNRWWTYTGEITALSDTLYGVSGTPEVSAT